MQAAFPAVNPGKTSTWGCFAEKSATSGPRPARENRDRPVRTALLPTTTTDHEPLTTTHHQPLTTNQPSHRCAEVRLRGVPELDDEGVLLQGLLDDAALNALSATMDQTHLVEACVVSGRHIFGHDRCDIAGCEGVQIQGAFDRNAHGWELGGVGSWESGVGSWESTSPSGRRP